MRMTKPEIRETEARLLPHAGLPRTKTGDAAPAGQPLAPPQTHDPQSFPVAVRIVCGVIAAVFAAGVYLTPNLTSLFWTRAIFVLGVFVFGQVAVLGRFGREAAAP
jgi:hypothetical protein